MNIFKVPNEIMQKNERICAKRPFTIDFRELGWDHMIIEPKYLSSFYCAGSCDLPLDDSVAPTNHAILIALTGRLRRYDYLPTVCCKPNKLTSKMFLFVDEYNNFVIKKLNDLIVDSCSCQ
jgi:bone morphogenetic protein 3/3B